MYLPLWDYSFMEMAPLTELKTPSWGEDSKEYQGLHFWRRFLHRIQDPSLLEIWMNYPWIFSFVVFECLWSIIWFAIWVLVRGSSPNPPPIHEDRANKGLVLHHLVSRARLPQTGTPSPHFSSLSLVVLDQIQKSLVICCSVEFLLILICGSSVWQVYLPPLAFPTPIFSHQFWFPNRKFHLK